MPLFDTILNVKQKELIKKEKVKKKNKKNLTFSSVNAATSMGEKKPGVVPRKFIMPYKVPA